jgi:hypothetical protein
MARQTLSHQIPFQKREPDYEEKRRVMDRMRLAEMSKGELKKRAIKNSVIDVDDIKQSIETDDEDNKFLKIEIPEDKYLVQIKDLFSWLDEARKDFYNLVQAFPTIKPEVEPVIKKWFGSDKEVLQK